MLLNVQNLPLPFQGQREIPVCFPARRIDRIRQSGNSEGKKGKLSMSNADAFRHKSKNDLRERKTNYSPKDVKAGKTRNQAKYRYRKVTI